MGQLVPLRIGMSEKQLAALRQKLDGHMLIGGKNGKPPKCYKVTGAAAETPDVWISHPEKSVVGPCTTT
jgi:hypothetical protein